MSRSRNIPNRSLARLLVLGAALLVVPACGGDMDPAPAPRPGEGIEEPVGVVLSDNTARGVQTVNLVEGISLEYRRMIEIFTPSRLILAGLVILGVYFGLKLLALLLARITRRRTSWGSRIRKLMPLLNFGIWFLTFLVVAVGVFARSFLAAGIVLAFIALGFAIASLHLLRDLVGAFIILLERPFQIGDHIETADHGGEVISIGLRAFHLQAADGSTVVIPNAEVLRRTIANFNPGALDKQVTVDLILPRHLPIEECKRVALEAAVVSPYVYTNKPIDAVVEETHGDPPAAKIVVTAYVFDAKFEQRLKSDIIENTRKGMEGLSGGLSTHAGHPDRHREGRHQGQA